MGDTVLTSTCPPRVERELAERGFRVTTVEVGEFHKSGGSVRCLTLPLDLPGPHRADLTPRRCRHDVDLTPTRSPAARLRPSGAGRCRPLEAAFCAHNYHPLDVVLASGEGARVDRHRRARRYLDFLSAYSALNFGHRHPAWWRRPTASSTA